MDQECEEVSPFELVPEDLKVLVLKISAVIKIQVSHPRNTQEEGIQDAKEEDKAEAVKMKRLLVNIDQYKGQKCHHGATQN